MYELELWATYDTVEDRDYWEGRFPGHGDRLVSIMAPFKGWRPVFAPPDDDLLRDIEDGTLWMGQGEIIVAGSSQGPEFVSRLTETIAQALRRKCDDRFKISGHDRYWVACNETVGDAFGPVIGDRGDPDVFLRLYLYELFIEVIECVRAGDELMLAQLELILKHWRMGHFLLGFDTSRDLPVAYVFVADL